jgi:hypothetical protein
MNYELSGLPLHVLLVHAVIVIVPLAALCTVLSILWPAARRRLGVLTPLIAFVALALVPLTVQAGMWLFARVGVTPLIRAHARLGNTLLPWAAAVFVLAVAQWLWFRYWTDLVSDRCRTRWCRRGWNLRRRRRRPPPARRSGIQGGLGRQLQPDTGKPALRCGSAARLVTRHSILCRTGPARAAEKPRAFGQIRSSSAFESIHHSPPGGWRNSMRAGVE